MNERIEELSLQCIRYKLIAEGARSDFDYKKFAELIIRECIEQVWYTREDGINGNVSEVIKERMKEHFGVES